MHVDDRPADPGHHRPEDDGGDPDRHRRPGQPEAAPDTRTIATAAIRAVPAGPAAPAPGEHGTARQEHGSPDGDGPEEPGLGRRKGGGAVEAGVEGGGGGEGEGEHGPEAVGAEGGDDDREDGQRQGGQQAGPAAPGEPVGHGGGEPEPGHHAQDQLRGGRGRHDRHPEGVGRPAYRPAYRRDRGRGRDPVGGVAADALGQQQRQPGAVAGDGHRHRTAGGEGADGVGAGDGGEDGHDPTAVAEQAAAPGGGDGGDRRQAQVPRQCRLVDRTHESDLIVDAERSGQRFQPCPLAAA